MREKYLIINGDDAGIDHERNEGLLQSFEQGVLTSITALVNGPAFHEIVGYVAGHPDLGMGIHLNLTEGRALSGKANSLTNKAGDFHPKAKVWEDAWHGRLDREAMHNEFRAQLDAFRQTGLTPTHLDGHNHIHLFPQVLDVILALGKEYHEIRSLRLVSEGLPFYGTKSAEDVLPDIELASAAKEVRRLYRQGHQKVGFFRHLSDLARPKIAGKLNFPDEFHGIHLAANFTRDNFELVIAGLKARVTEIMAHPGFMSSRSVNFSRSHDRCREYAVLTDQRIKKKVAALGLTLTDYSILGKNETI